VFRVAAEFVFDVATDARSVAGTLKDFPRSLAFTVPSPAANECFRPQHDRIWRIHDEELVVNHADKFRKLKNPHCHFQLLQPDPMQKTIIYRTGLVIMRLGLLCIQFSQLATRLSSMA
jgi:hypothetical protein